MLKLVGELRTCIRETYTQLSGLEKKSLIVIREVTYF
jgi:hypothetical protein